MTDKLTQLPMLGWREWVALPEFGIAQIKAKIDTGARSSALHADTIEPYQKGGENWLMFTVQPMKNKANCLSNATPPSKTAVWFQTLEAINNAAMSSKPSYCSDNTLSKLK